MQGAASYNVTGYPVGLAATDLKIQFPGGEAINLQATTHVPKILKKLAETKGTRVWDDAFRSYNDPRFVSFEGITGFKDFYLNCFQISLREELPKLISYKSPC
ncbi:hypothetical protein [Candidatus Midichloria mitochondrii]|uniref:hypothetical protein n=1 Tax=Candidatus Midichloria mitochondrii TaxID=234827 RepID=UPI00059CE5E9|nr:hypothetical protein [Candidatus Midichloria mitochondrii]